WRRAGRADRPVDRVRPDQCPVAGVHLALAAGLMSGRWQRPFIGPFTMFQTVAVMVAVLVTALVLVFINTPLSNPATPGLPTPGSSFVAVGDPVEGLRVGDLAPEFSGTNGTSTVGLVDLDG